MMQLSRVSEKIVPKKLRLSVLRVLSKNHKKYTCPICSYRGPFLKINQRKAARCPDCGSLERHRVQYLVFEKLIEKLDFSEKSILHIAPEQFFKKLLRTQFKTYTTGDLHMKNVDYNFNLIDMPFDDNKFNFIFASHVLEHIQDIDQVLKEIQRVLTTDGIAVLPVPIVSEETIEYPKSYEDGHVRAPGLDFYDKYLQFFKKIEIFNSDQFSLEHQLYSYEDRTIWPTKDMPLRRPMVGEKHPHFIPVCYEPIKQVFDST